MRRTSIISLLAVLGLVAAGCVQPPPPPPPDPEPCQPGTFSVDGEEPCTPAPVGTFVDTVGATEATPCPEGTFQDQQGQVACEAAPPGTFVDVVGAAEATLCPLGRFQPLAGQTSCLLAPIGTYVDAVGSIAATDCPPDTTTASEGATSVADCVPLPWVVSTLAANPNGFAFLYSIAQGSDGTLYVSSRDSHTIKAVDPDSGAVTNLAGDGTAGDVDGPAANARFHSPVGIAVDGSDNVFVYDSENDKIRKITPGGVVSTFFTLDTGFFNVDGLDTDSSGNVYVVDGGDLLRISPTGVPTTVATGVGWDRGLAVDTNGDVYLGDNTRIYRVEPDGTETLLAGSTSGFIDGQGSAARFGNWLGLEVVDGTVYVVDLWNNAVRMVDPAGNVSTIAGNGTSGYVDGPGPDARFSYPGDVVVDPSGDLFIAEGNGQRVRKMTM